MEELFENPQAIILLVFMVIAALKFIGENLKGKKKEDETQPLADLYEDSREEILERQRSTSPPPPPLQKQPPPEQLSILDFLGPPVGSQPAEEVSSSPPPPLPRPVAVPPLPFTPKPKPSLSAAEKAFRAALERQPGLAAGHYNLGNLLLDGERPDAALAAYEATLRLQPEHADALINMAATLLRLERAQDALAAYRHFLQVHGREHPLAASVVAEIERLAGNR